MEELPNKTITLAVSAYYDEWHELRFQDNEPFMKLGMFSIHKGKDGLNSQEKLNEAILDKYKSYPYWNTKEHSTSLPMPDIKRFTNKDDHGYRRTVFINNGDPFEMQIGELFYASGLMKSRGFSCYAYVDPCGFEKYSNLPNQADDSYSNDSDDLYLYIWSHKLHLTTVEEREMWSETYPMYSGNMYLYKFLPFYDETQTPYPKTREFKKENRFVNKLQIERINFNEITEFKYNCILPEDDQNDPNYPDKYDACDCSKCRPISDVCTRDPCYICPMIDDCRNNKCHNRFGYARDYCSVCNRHFPKKENEA